HPAALLGRQPLQQPPRLRDAQLRTAELADTRALDAPAERERHRLHPVADTEDRHAELEQLRAQPRCFGRVDGCRTAAENESARPARAELLELNRVRQQLAEHAA